MQLREKLPPNAPDGYELVSGYIIDFKTGKLGSKTLKTTVEEKIEEVKKDGNLAKPLAETKTGEYSGFTYSAIIEMKSTYIYLPFKTKSYIEIHYEINDKNNRLSK